MISPRRCLWYHVNKGFAVGIQALHLYPLKEVSEQFVRRTALARLSFLRGGELVFSQFRTLSGRGVGALAARGK